MRQLRLAPALGFLCTLSGCGGDQFSSAPGKPGSGGDTTSAAGAGGQPGSGGHVGAGGATSGGGAAGAGGGAAGAGGSTITVKDAAPAHWCDGQQALFCADFDEVSSIATFLSSWTTFATTGGDFSLDNGADVPSPPNALRIKTSATNNVKALVVKKIAPFSNPPSKLRLEFSLRIDAASNIQFLSGAAFAALMMGAEVTDGVVALEIGNGPALGAAYLEPTSAGTGFNASAVQGAFPKLNEWSGRYAVEIDYADGPNASRTGCVWVLVGGVRQLTQCLKLPPTLVDPPYVSVALGVYSGGLGDTGDVQLRFDNVILTAE